jgi:CheY-like chemotaxis protein
MKKLRLDEILLRIGAVSEEQIKQALLRQKSRGGKIGSLLLYYRYLTEDQLVQALAEQFGVSGVRLGTYEIPESVIKKIPVNIAEEYLAIPFKFDHEKGELFVATADPENTAAISAIKRTSGVSKIIVNVAPEIVIRNKIAFHYRGLRQSTLTNHIIDLPDLFEDETENQSKLSKLQTNLDMYPQHSTNILMFTNQVFLKNVLPSIFEREGLHVSVVSTTSKIAESLKATSCHRILISEDVQEEFESFVSEYKNITLLPEVTVFRTVGSSLMENPVPYNKMFACVLTAIQYIADQRTSDLSWSPPYALMSNEIMEVGHSMGLSRIVIDGLRVAMHLLIPSVFMSEDVLDPDRSQALNMFKDIETSIQIARSLDFPWDISTCLNFLRTPAPDNDSEPELTKEKELSIAAGILALIWYRHHFLRTLSGGRSGDLEILKSKIRQQEGHLAPSSVVEAYVRMLEQTGHLFGAGTDIFIIGEIGALSSGLVTELKHHGFKIVEAKNFQAAHKLYSRRRPDAILIHIDKSLSVANEFCRYIRKDAGDTFTALFAVTRRSEPSFLLNLMDTWFSDVLTLPLNSQVVVTRISKALSNRGKGVGGPVGQGFSAAFIDLSFVDLVQALGSGAKSVRMQIEHSSGTQAIIFLRQGQIVHASCGDVKGVDAVYQVIRWRDDGSFRVEPTNEFPPDNVSASNDYILLEGCRLFDESEAET